MYAGHCLNDSHELYDMKDDPIQMVNLHPRAPNPVNREKILGHPIHKVLYRLDALLLVLKSCKHEGCRKPWKQLHPNAQVNTLLEALDERWDEKYKNLDKVNYKKCYKNGTYKKKDEGNQWGGETAAVFTDGAWTSPIDQGNSTDGIGDDADDVVDVVDEDDAEANQVNPPDDVSGFDP